MKGVLDIMSNHAIAYLMQKIDEKNSRVVVGLDPTKEVIPSEYSKAFSEMENGGSKEVLYDYCKDIIDAVYDVVPAVKPNIAFFERYGAEEIFFRVCKYAKKQGLVVIADAKRADIGSTSEAYADAFLVYSPCDFLTINPYFGEDSVKPFIDACNENGKGVFVLVKTSNPSSKQIQDLVTEDGKTVYEKVGELVANWGTIDASTGYSNVGAVVGATHPQQAIKLRALMPNTFFLVPGFGAQGATVNDIIGNFDSNGNGAIINASRSILAAWKQGQYAENGMDFKAAARIETINMRDAINKAVSENLHK